MSGQDPIDFSNWEPRFPDDTALAESRVREAREKAITAGRLGHSEMATEYWRLAAIETDQLSWIYQMRNQRNKPGKAQKTQDREEFILRMVEEKHTRNADVIGKELTDPKDPHYSEAKRLWPEENDVKRDRQVVGFGRKFLAKLNFTRDPSAKS
jgi:hypothetical protein